MYKYCIYLKIRFFLEGLGTLLPETSTLAAVVSKVSRRFLGSAGATVCPMFHV